MSASESTNAMNWYLRRMTVLLADLVEAEGTANLPEDTDTIPYGTITVPDDRQYYGFPNGTTTFNFADGKVTHQTEGDILSIPDVRSLSRSLDSSAHQLRSLYCYVDAPAQLSFDGDNTRTLEAGQHYTFQSQGYTRVSITSDYSFDVTLAASTRRDTLTVSSSGAHAERKGSRSGGAYDSWESMRLATPNVWQDFTVTTDLADTEWYVRPFDAKTIQVVNGSAADNDVDVRVMAADTPYDESNNIDDFYEIAKVTNLSQNDRHKFVITEPHHELRVQFQNSTNGETVAAGCTCVGVN